jgi:predicted ATPase
VEQTPRLFSVLGLLGSYYLSSGQYQLSLKIAWQLFELGQRSQDPLQVALARLGLGANYSQLGEFTRSEEHLRKLIEFYDYREHHAGVPYYGIDPGVNGLIWLALVMWVRGFPDQAERYSQEAIDLARILEHPFSLTAALEVSAGIMHVLGRDFAAARRDLDESLQLATMKDFGLFQVEGSYYQGVILVAEGHGDEGITQMKSSLTAWRATGMRIMYPLMLGLLAEALGRSGKIREGLQTLDEAFATVIDGNEQFFVAELYRIKGDLLQRGGGEMPDIETAYQQAITLARQQAAKSWQLRATIRLARLFQATSRYDEARLALAEIFDWFTEGFNTHDLQEALALLVELRGR